MGHTDKPARVRRDKLVVLNPFLAVRGIPARLAKALHRAADMGGTIQGRDMVRLLPGASPTAHRTCSLIDALRAAGGEVVFLD